MKLEEYTVVLRSGKFGKDIPFEPAPFNTIVVNYQDDVLIIRAYAMNVEKVFVIRSILDRRDQIKIEYKEPKHDTLLITYIVLNIDTNVEYFPTIVLPRNTNKLNESPIVIEYISNGLRLYTSKNFDAQILKLLTGKGN